MTPRQPLGEIMVRLGYFTKSQLDGTLAHQRQWGLALGRSAVACGFCTEAQVLEALARQLGLPWIDLDKVELRAPISPLIPHRFAEQHKVVPIRTSGARAETLVVAMAPPASLAEQDAVRAVSGRSKLEVYIASDEAITRGIARAYLDAQSYGGPAGAPAEARFTARDQPLELPSEDSIPRCPGAPRSDDDARGDATVVAGDGAVAAYPLIEIQARSAQSRVPYPEDDLVGRLGLSPRAFQLIDALARKHRLTCNDVLRRMLDQWAERQRPMCE